MKIKIRRIEVDTQEFLAEVERIILIDEKIPAQTGYLGTNLKTIFEGLGLKEIDFWELAQKEKFAFKSKFIIYKENFKGGRTLLFRRVVWEGILGRKSEELEW